MEKVIAYFDSIRVQLHFAYTADKDSKHAELTAQLDMDTASFFDIRKFFEICDKIERKMRLCAREGRDFRCTIGKFTYELCYNTEHDYTYKKMCDDNYWTFSAFDDFHGMIFTPHDDNDKNLFDYDVILAALDMENIFSDYQLNA